MNKKILLIGGGGHCKSVLDSLISLNEYSEIGIIDTIEKKNQNIFGIPIVGNDDDLERLFSNGYEYAFITIGSTGNPSIRIRVYEKLLTIGFKIPNIVDQSAIVSSNTKLEEGIFIGKQCIVNASSYIKKCAIINSGSIIEHDCEIGAFAHIAPGVVLSGGVKVGENTHIGSNSTVKQSVQIGEDVLIGLGSVVTKNINNKVIAYGNPCKEVRQK